MVRIQEIQIRDFKNVENGIIKFPNKKANGDFLNTAEVIGIYGQNGSGKTAVVEAFTILKEILSGESITGKMPDYIMSGKKSCEFKLTLYVELNEKKYFFRYTCIIGENREKKYNTIKEEVSYKEFNEKSWSKEFKRLFLIESGKENTSKFDFTFDPFDKSDVEDYLQSVVDAKMAEREGKSFIFSKDFSKHIVKSNNAELISSLVEKVQYFTKVGLFIVANNQLGLITGNIMIPLSIFLKEQNNTHQGIIPIGMHGSSILPIVAYEVIVKTIDNMNIVLNNLVPNLKITINESGKEIDKNSEEVMRFQLMSLRKDKEIPIEYESEGIKKIISILSMLIVTYNNPSFTLIIDEFDAGIYEYLFGEILDIMSTSGKGQLLFTSHNLRPLEVLHPSNIRFTTTDPKNKYVKMKDVKQNNNLRDKYMRNIVLGGDDYSLYEETRDYKIKRAFRMAWNDVNE